MRKRSGGGMAAKAVAVLAAVMLVGACGGSPQARSITLTFIRHAESEANAAGVIDTSVPGPSLSQQGKAQAEEVAHSAGHNKFDGIYASTMVRSQQTAAPLAGEMGKHAEVLQGIQEIDAGWYEGKPVSAIDPDGEAGRAFAGLAEQVDVALAPKRRYNAGLKLIDS